MWNDAHIHLIFSCPSMICYWQYVDMFHHRHYTMCMHLYQPFLIFRRVLDNDEKFVFLTNTTIEEMHSEWNILKRKLKREIALSKKYTKLLIYAWSNILKYRIIIRYVTVTRAVPRARFSISCLDCLSLDMKLYLNPRSFTSHLNWWIYLKHFRRSYFSLFSFLNICIFMIFLFQNI